MATWSHMATITRAAVGSPVKVRTTFYSLDSEAPVDADASVTVQVVHVNGTTLVASENATAEGGGTYSVTVPAQTDPACAVATFQGTFSGIARQQTADMEIVGAHWVELADMRALDGLSDVTSYPTSVLVEKRTAAEQRFEAVTGRAWVQRYARDVLDGDPFYRRAWMPSDTYTYPHLTRRLELSHRIPRRLLTLTIDGAPETDLTQYFLYRSGELERAMGMPGFPRGIENIVVEYVHGHDGPPPDLREAFLKYVRKQVLGTTSSIPDNATMMQTDFGMFQLAQPDARLRPTGMPEVDAVLLRYGEWTPAMA